MHFMKLLVVVLVAALMAGCDSGGFVSRLRGDESSARSLYERVSQHDAQAHGDLRKRAQGRDAYAAFYAGLAEDPSLHPGGNAIEAAEMYGLAANALPTAKHNLALLILKGVRRPSDTPQTALALLEESADKGIVESMLLLGTIYEKGWRGIPVNPALAVQWYERANVFSNDPRAQYRLGVACLDGFGRSRDEDEAFRLLTAAAKRGLVEAQRELGVRMSDPVQSAQWLSVAAINEPGYRGQADQAMAKLALQERIKVQRSAQMWAHAHQDDMDLPQFADPIKQSTP